MRIVSFRGVGRVLVVAALLSVGLLAGHCVSAAMASTLPQVLALADMDGLDADREIVSGPFAGALVVPHGVRDSKDAKFNEPYHAACYVYVAQRAPGGEAIEAYARRFIVHAPEPESLALARQVARELLLCYGENHSRLRFDHPADEPTVDVWLTRKVGAGLSADVGGEQFTNQIYLYDIYASRRPIEWAREVAHEYGHYALPGVSGFTAPENWANGVLGERLFLKWLAEDVRSGRVRPEDLAFVKPEELEGYVSLQIEPLVRRVARDGADAHALERRDASGMDSYIGFALYLDTVYGSKALLDALAYTTPKAGSSFVKAPDFLRGALDSLRGATQFTITPPAFSSGKPSAFLVYLPRGEYAVTAGDSVRSWSFPEDAKGVHPEGRDGLIVAISDWRKLTINAKPSSSGSERLQFRRRAAELQ